MNLMKSFGLGYKMKDEMPKEAPKDEASKAGVAEEKKKENTPQFDVHINLWDVPSGQEGNKNPFIDFGIKVTNYHNIKYIVFTTPFFVEQQDITDLSYVLKGDEARLIFNDIKYQYEEPAQKFHGISDDNEKMAFLPIKKSLHGGYFNGVEEDVDDSKSYCSLIIDIDKYINLISDKTTAIYFRFRIESELVAKSLLATLKEKNYYLESAFVERQIIDIKFNDARNIDRNVISWYKNEEYLFSKMKSIHLFVMVPSSYEITIWDDFSECRQLENGVWNSYLEDKISTKNVMAYHWKKKASDENYLDEFTQLIRIEHRATNWKIILIYCIIVIVLGALGSGLCDIIKLMCGFSR